MTLILVVIGPRPREYSDFNPALAKGLPAVSLRGGVRPRPTPIHPSDPDAAYKILHCADEREIQGQGIM